MHEGMQLRYPEERYAAISEYEADHVPTVLTSGTTLQQRNGIRRSEVVLNSQLCWYLDAASELAQIMRPVGKMCSSQHNCREAICWTVRGADA